MTRREFHYRLPGPASGHFPGAHRSPRGDSGFEFRRHLPLADAPDARRLDIHASLRDPFGSWQVRVYAQRMATPVFMVADLSASMGFAGRHRKLDTLADLAEGLAYAASRCGDPYGFIGCDQGLRRDLLLPLTRTRGAGLGFGLRLRGLTLGEGGSADAGAEGLLQAATVLPRRRSLVFLASDFHLPVPLIEAVLARLAGHMVVPVVIWDPMEFSVPAGRGLAPLRDPETGEERLVWLRPVLRERWSRLEDERRALLGSVFRRHRLRPLHLADGHDPDAVTAYFFGSA